MGRPAKNPEDRYRTPLASFRIPADLKAKAQRVAKERDETLTDVVIRALRAYVRRHG